MNLLKKITSAAAITAVIAAQTAVFAEFTDMPSGEMGTALQHAVDNGLITGLDEHTIAPDAFITRAQMAAIITRAFGAVNEVEISFPDVAEDAWYRDSVKKAVAMSAFKGDENGNFNPENKITFQEAYTVLSRVFYLEPNTVTLKDGSKTTLHNVDDSALNTFTDKDEVAGWAKLDVQSVVANGGWTGIDGMLKPTASMTRGEFALIMDKLVTTYIDKPGSYTELPDGLTVVRVGGVAIDGFKSSKNLILSYGVDKDGCIISNADIKGATIVLGGANPVEAKDSTTGESKLVADTTAYVALAGRFADIISPVPYTVVNLAGAEWLNYYGVENTRVLIGDLQ